MPFRLISGRRGLSPTAHSSLRMLFPRGSLKQLPPGCFSASPGHHLLLYWGVDFCLGFSSTQNELQVTQREVALTLGVSITSLVEQPLISLPVDEGILMVRLHLIHFRTPGVLKISYQAINCVCMYIYIFVGTWIMGPVWRTGYLFYSFLHVARGHLTQAVRLLDASTFTPWASVLAQSLSLNTLYVMW